MRLIERGIYEHPNPSKKGWFVIQVPGIDPKARVRVEFPGPKLASARYRRGLLQIAVVKARQGDPSQLEQLLGSTKSTAIAKPETVAPVLFQELSDDYLADLKKRSERGEIGEDYWRNFDYRKPKHNARFGKREAASIKAHEITSYLDDLKVGPKRDKTPAPATYNAYRLDLLSMWDLAIGNEKLQFNPVQKVPFLPVNNERKRFATEEEDAKIREAIRKECPDREAELDLFVFTGMREDEGWSLRREDVNTDVKLVLLRDTKNNTDEFIPLCAEALAAIKELDKRADGSGYVIPNRPDLFSKLKSKRAKRYSVKWFRTLCRKLGVRDFRFHDLRHTFATRVRLSGAEITTIKDLLRHKDLKSTMRYAHVGNEHLLAAVQKAGAAFRPKPAPKPVGKAKTGRAVKRAVGL